MEGGGRASMGVAPSWARDERERASIYKKGRWMRLLTDSNAASSLLFRVSGVNAVAEEDTNNSDI